MDKLLEVSAEQASSATTTSVADLDENLFQKFMKKNLVGELLLYLKG